MPGFLSSINVPFFFYDDVKEDEDLSYKELSQPLSALSRSARDGGTYNVALRNKDLQFKPKTLSLITQH